MNRFLSNGSRFCAEEMGKPANGWPCPAVRGRVPGSRRWGRGRAGGAGLGEPAARGHRSHGAQRGEPGWHVRDKRGLEPEPGAQGRRPMDQSRPVGPARTAPKLGELLSGLFQVRDVRLLSAGGDRGHKRRAGRPGRGVSEHGWWPGRGGGPGGDKRWADLAAFWSRTSGVLPTSFSKQGRREPGTRSRLEPEHPRGWPGRSRPEQEIGGPALVEWPLRRWRGGGGGPGRGVERDRESPASR